METELREELEEVKKVNEKIRKEREELRTECVETEAANAELRTQYEELRQHGAQLRRDGFTEGKLEAMEENERKMRVREENRAAAGKNYPLMKPRMFELGRDSFRTFLSGFRIFSDVLLFQPYSPLFILTSRTVQP